MAQMCDNKELPSASKLLLKEKEREREIKISLEAALG